MTGATRGRFYARLSDAYSDRIRQLVPLYDDMLRCIVELAALLEPRRILDLGAGTGEVSRGLLHALPEARVIAIDPSAEMVAVARGQRESVGDRWSIVRADADGIETVGGFDLVTSNLVLHNLPTSQKQHLLRRIRTWLVPSGVFLWGDFIRHHDPRLHDHYMEQRATHAVAAGCPPEIVNANFDKERHEDFPCTVDEAMALAQRAGFEEQQIVWMHDTFAIFCMMAPR